MHATDILIIGAGQAGLALSHHLTQAGAEHVLLERGRVGERWRSERWPSLHLLTPNWLNRLPATPPARDPDGFMAVGELVAELEAYAAARRAPVQEGRTVRSVVREGGGYRVRTDAAAFRARSVVIATGDCDRPAVPRIPGRLPARVEQLHTSAYRTPGDLAPGGVLVVGAGASGQQIALELRRAGRRVVLAAGAHGRMVRRYRGRDGFAWLAALGRLDEGIDDVRDPEAARGSRSPALSGARGGEDLDLGVLQREGVELAGRLVGFDGGRARFADDLAATTARADAALRRVLAQIDQHLARTPGPPAPPPEPAAPVVCPEPLGSLPLADIGTVLWATGYRRAYPWLHVPVLDARGEIVHRQGATPAPGLHVLGLRFQQRRGSHLIGGVGRDAAELAARLTAPRRRLAGAPPRELAA